MHVELQPCSQTNDEEHIQNVSNKINEKQGVFILSRLIWLFVCETVVYHDFTKKIENKSRALCNSKILICRDAWRDVGV